MKIDINKIHTVSFKKAKNISKVLTQHPNNHIFTLIMLKSQPEWKVYAHKLGENLAAVNADKSLAGLLVFSCSSFKALISKVSRIFNFDFPKDLEESNFISMEGPSLESQFKYFAVGITEK